MRSPSQDPEGHVCLYVSLTWKRMQAELQQAVAELQQAVAELQQAVAELQQVSDKRRAATAEGTPRGVMGLPATWSCSLQRGHCVARAVCHVDTCQGEGEAMPRLPVAWWMRRRASSTLASCVCIFRCVNVLWLSVYSL